MVFQDEREREKKKRTYDGERQTAIQSEANGFINLCLVDLSLAVMVGTMALGRC